MSIFSKTLITLSALGAAALGSAGTYSVVQVTPMVGITARSGDAYGISGGEVYYNLATLSVGGAAPFQSSGSDQRSYAAQTVYKVKWTPAPGETSHPGTILATVRVKRYLDAYCWASYGPGGGTVNFDTAAYYKSNGPDILLQFNTPSPYWAGGTWQETSGGTGQIPIAADEYMGFTFTQDPNGDWVSTQSFPVTMFQKAAFSSSSNYSHIEARSQVSVKFKMIEIDGQVLDPTY